MHSPLLGRATVTRAAPPATSADMALSADDMAAELRSLVSLFESGESTPTEMAADAASCGEAAAHVANSVALLAINGELPSWSSAEGKQLAERYSAACRAVGLACLSRCRPNICFIFNTQFTCF